jgi:hypothetical protein
MRSPIDERGHNGDESGVQIVSNAKATVVVVPRERFSLARRSLESLIEHTR